MKHDVIIVGAGHNGLVTAGLLAQAGLDVLDALISVAPVSSGAARSYLARFLFRGDDVLKPVSELSGGERSRLELALLGAGGTILDTLHKKSAQ